MSAEQSLKIEAHAIAAVDVKASQIRAGEEFYERLANGAGRIPASQIAPAAHGRYDGMEFPA